MTQEIEKQYFIPANLIEFKTQPTDTLQDKLGRLIRDLVTAEDQKTYPQIFILKHKFVPQEMGYNVLTRLTY